MDIQTCLGKLDRVIAEYSTFMPFTTEAEIFYKQHSHFFMVLPLAGLPPDLEVIHNQILSSSIVSTHKSSSRAVVASLHFLSS